MRPLFASARLQLTVWYSLMVIFISSVLSGLYYYRTARILEAEYDRIEGRLLRNPVGQLVYPPQSVVRGFLAEDLRLAKQRIFVQLVLIDSVMVFLFTVLGYVLAGKTLAPIQKAHEEQRRFVGDAAHELKTPIAALKTSLEVSLLDPELPKAARPVLKDNLQDVANLEALSEALIKLARVSDVPLTLVKIDLGPILKRAAKTVRLVAKAKQVQITLSLLSHPVYIQGDEAMMYDLVLILLDNAIKYSPPQTSVTLALSVAKHKVVIKVTDQGAGISPEHLPHIFERFYRADQARSHQLAGGHGLGLSIAAKIAEEHQATIKVDSQLGLGSIFTVSLPQVEKIPQAGG